MTLPTPPSPSRISPAVRAIIGVAILCAVLFAGLWIAGHAALGGWLLVIAFFCLFMACTRIEALKSLSYTMLILSLVCVAMFYPKPLQGYGDLKFVAFIPLMLQLIMFGVGSQMSIKDFEGVIKMPKAVFVGLATQFTIMPLLGFALSRIFTFNGAEVAVSLGLAHQGQIDPAQAQALSGAIAAGVVLIGCSPSGLASNVMCFLARGNLALSVTVAACATMIAPIMTPVLMKLLAGTLVEVSVVAMMHDVIRMLVYPIMAGLLFNAVATARPWRGIQAQLLIFAGLIVVLQTLMGLLKQTDTNAILRSIALTLGLVVILSPLLGAGLRYITNGSAEVVKRLMAFFSMGAICVILSVITAANRESLLKIGLLMILVMFLHNIGGYTFGYLIARLFRLDDRSCRTLAIELGQQNGGLANGLAASLPIDAALRTLMGIAPAVFGAIQNITGSALATWWRGIPYRDEASREAEQASEEAAGIAHPHAEPTPPEREQA